LYLVDDDTVEDHNLPGSAYRPDQVGLRKAFAMADNVRAWSETDAVGIPARVPGHLFSPLDIATEVLVVALDSLEGRQRIWETLVRSNRTVKFLVDARSGLDAVQIYNAVLPLGKAGTASYEKALYDIDPIHVPCSARSVAYNGNTCAGIVGAMVKAWSLREAMPEHVWIDHKSWLFQAGPYRYDVSGMAS
jgi:hypothetical protein